MLEKKARVSEVDRQASIYDIVFYTKAKQKLTEVEQYDDLL